MSQKVLVKNVKLFFECENCPEKTESDPVELCTSGVPICMNCEREMSLCKEALIIN